MITLRSGLAGRVRRRFNLADSHIEVDDMTHEDRDHKFDIDPATILLGIAYLTSFVVAIGWIASLAI